MKRTYTKNKYLIISGCSYAFIFPDDLPLMITSDNVSRDMFKSFKIIRLGQSSAGNEFIVETTMIAVQHLLDKGVDPRDICVINNFTQIYRPMVKVPPEYFEKASKLVDEYVKDTRSIFGIDMKTIGSLTKLKNQIYSFLTIDWHLDGELKTWYNHQSKKVITQKTIQEHFEFYLSNIILLQTFLKKNNVFGIHFLMNNVFDGWTENFEHIYSNHHEPSVPSTKDTLHISDISDYTKVLWNSIDLDMFSFYSTEENKYGGIDEYMIDYFCDPKYMQDDPMRNIHFKTYFGNHPQREVYIDFANKFMIDKLKKWYDNSTR